MKKINHRQVYDGDWVTIDRKMSVACCHCGLVHDLIYSWRKPHPKVVPVLMKRVHVNRRMTTQLRKDPKHRAKYLKAMKIAKFL